MQVLKLSNIELLSLLEEKKNDEKTVKELLHEINHRININKLTFKDKEKTYLYLYMLLSNKYNDIKTMNELIEEKEFIQALDRAKINGSTILSLTDKCIKPRTLLLKTSKNIKDSIINSDELLDTTDILDELTKEEIRILREDVEIDNYLVLNGIRFDTLNESTIKSLIDDIILFQNYDIKTIRAFANSYEKIEDLANNQKFLDIYMSKLDDYLSEENKIFKYLTITDINNMKSKLTDIMYLHLVKDAKSDVQNKLLKDKKVTELLVNCNDINVLEKLPKEYLITLLSEKENLLSGINLIMLKNLNKQELAKVAKKSKHFYSDLVERITRDTNLDFKPFISALPPELLKDLGTKHLGNFNFDVLRKLLDSNKAFFKESILKNRAVSNYLVNRDNEEEILELLDDADFNIEERVRLLDNCYDIRNVKNISKITYTINPENLRVPIYKNDYLRNCILNDRTFKLDSYTTRYLLNNTEEIMTRPVDLLINLLITADIRFTEDLLSNELVLTKVFKEGSKENPAILVDLLRAKPQLLPFYKMPQIKEYYNAELLTNLRDYLDQNEMNNICTDDVIKNIYQDEELIKTYKKLLNNNAYLLNTLNFNIINENTKDLRLAILDQITKYPSIQDSIVEISKKYLLTTDFLNQFYFATKDLNITTINDILEVFKQSVQGENRKRVGNLVKMITVSAPGYLTKNNFGSLIDYLLYFVPRYNNIKANIIKTPITLNEIIKYENEVNTKLTSLINKKENVRENFLLKHFKLTTEESLSIIKCYSIERIDSSIYKQEYEFLYNLNRVFNTDEESLVEMDSKYKVMTMYESFLMEEKIKNMYGKIYNFEIRSKTYANKPFIKEIFGKELKIYTCPSDFLFLVSNVNITEEYNKTNSFLLGWHNTVNKLKNGIHASLIANDNLVLREDVTFGFNGVLENGILDISPFFDKHTKYMTPRELIDNTRDINNRVTLDKYAIRPNFNNSNLPNIEPDFILVDMNRLDDKNYLEKISRASSEFKTKRNKEGLPIIAVDKNKITNNELSKISTIFNKYQKNHDMLLLNSIVTKLANNYTAYQNTDKELATKFNNHILLDTVRERISNSNSISEIEYIENVFREEENKYKYIKKNPSSEEYIKDLKTTIDNRIEELNRG